MDPKQPSILMGFEKFKN